MFKSTSDIRKTHTWQAEEVMQVLGTSSSVVSFPINKKNPKQTMTEISRMEFPALLGTSSISNFCLNDMQKFQMNSWESCSPAENIYSVKKHQ